MVFIIYIIKNMKENEWIFNKNLYFWSYNNIRVIFSTRAYESIEEIMEVLQIKNYAYMKQTHSSRVLEVKEDGVYMADGIFTKEKNLALIVKVADCLPLFFFNDDIIGVIHAGWRGTVKKITSFIRNFDNIKYITGPSIRGCCYEVGEEVVKKFREENLGRSVKKMDGKYHIDILEENKSLIGNLEELNSLPLCTMCNSHIFYSYRNGDKGRNFGIIIRR